MNAKRFGNNFQLGSSISVVCEEGFIKTQGSDTIVCELEAGKVMWSGLIPKCEGRFQSACVRQMLLWNKCSLLGKIDLNYTP